MSGDKKLIYFLVALIIFLSIILLTKIKMTPQYNEKIYEEIYNEYKNIFGQEDNLYNINENTIKNTNEHSIILEENSNYTAVTSTINNIEQSNVIGKIIIPKIDIKYPIIKETTREYLKIAPTKYCGPEVNEIRKFSYSGA